MEPGPAVCWMRMRHPLLAGEEPTPLQRVLVAADSGNGISSTLDFRRFVFINVDLTVHLHRLPAGEWVCLDSLTIPEPNGQGMSDTLLLRRARPDRPRLSDASGQRALSDPDPVAAAPLRLVQRRIGSREQRIRALAPSRSATPAETVTPAGVCRRRRSTTIRAPSARPPEAARRTPRHRVGRSDRPRGSGQPSARRPPSAAGHRPRDRCRRCSP